MTRIKILSESRALLAPITSRIGSAEAKKVLDEALLEVAQVDGDRVLDQFEADTLRLTFESLVPAGSVGPITVDVARDLKSALLTRVAELKAERVSSTEAIFTSEGDALNVFRAKILGSIEDTLKKANGKKVDVNMMVFSFTDRVMADEIVALAKAHPNVTFRLLTDWTQLATSGSRQPPRLAKLAEDEGLTNLVVKFKKDDPYIWDHRAGRPVFSHGHTKGLNHHKGFVTLIDGRPEKMAFGSFNWSVSAMKSNYENLLLLDRKDADNRPIMKGYQKEFEGFWNNDDAALLFGEARKHKDELYKALHLAHGAPYDSFPVADDTLPDPVYEALDESTAFDLNSFADVDTAELDAIVGSALRKKIQKELRDYGRFDTWTELLVRVPDTAKLDTWARELLMENLEYGDGGLSINTASATELDRAGLSRRLAEKVVAFREQHGAFESLGELRDIKGIGEKTLERISDVMTDDGIMGAYSARVPGGAQTTGWSTSHHGTHAVPAEGDDGSAPQGGVVPPNRADLEDVNRDLAAPVIDLLRRTKPGQTFRLCMYGLSTSSAELQELERAIGRGVKVRAVIYKAYNEGAVSRLKELAADGFDVDVRILSSRVMHEKFGVAGDDVFNGSANWSSSSITKHSEDRFLFRNEPALAHRFIEEFARLWERGTEP